MCTKRFTGRSFVEDRYPNATVTNVFRHCKEHGLEQFRVVSEGIDKIVCASGCGECAWCLMERKLTLSEAEYITCQRHYEQQVSARQRYNDAVAANSNSPGYPCGRGCRTFNEHVIACLQ